MTNVKFLTGTETNLLKTNQDGTYVNPISEGSLYVTAELDGQSWVSNLYYDINGQRIKVGNTGGKASTDSMNNNIAKTYIKAISMEGAKYASTDGATLTYTRGDNTTTTILLPLASATTAGTVNTGAQTLTGIKTFDTNGGIVINNPAGFNYVGIEEANASADRVVWFADSAKQGKPVKSAGFKYNPGSSDSWEDILGRISNNVGTSNKYGKLTANVLEGIAAKAYADVQGHNISTSYVASMLFDSASDGVTLTTKNGAGGQIEKLTVPVATDAKSGIVTAEAQTIGGRKTFANGVTIKNGLKLELGSIFYSNDASLKIYPKTNTTYGNETIALQTAFDGKDPETTTYTTDYEDRCNLLLQPRGGQVYISKDLDSIGNTTYSLYVGGGSWLEGYNKMDQLSINGSDTSVSLYVGGAAKVQSKLTILGGVDVTGLLKVSNSGKTVTIGAQNAGYIHFTVSDSTTPFWFGNEVQMNSTLKPYSTNTVNLGTSGSRWLGGYFGSGGISVDGAGVFNGNVSINTHNTYDLGSNDKRWKNIYGETITATTFNGALNGVVTGTLVGNASTANKWLTARTITLGEDLQGSVSIDGSQNVTLSAKNYSASCSSGNTANYPWHRIATTGTVTSDYSDKDMIITIKGNYSGGPFGVAKVSLRTNNSSGGATASASVTWMYRSGFAVDALQIGLRNTAKNTLADLFLKVSTWARCTIYQTHGSRSWTLITSNEESNTTTSNKLKSTECYTSVSDASSLLNANYTSTITATDGATVKEANHAASAHGAVTDSSNNTINTHYLSDVTFNGTTDSSKVTIKLFNGLNQAKYTREFPVAGASSAGVITTGAQTLAGDKTINTSGSLTVQKTNGFNYSGISSGTDAVARHVWFSHSSKPGTPVVSDKFKYNPASPKEDWTAIAAVASDKTNDAFGKLIVDVVQGIAARAYADMQGSSIVSKYVSALSLTGSATSVTIDYSNGVPSKLGTLTIPNASETAAGIITNAAQTIGGTKTFKGDIHISHDTTKTMDTTTTNPKIVFSENGGQPVGIVYTDYDSYRSPAGLKIMNMSTGNGVAWLEVEGQLIVGSSSTFSGSLIPSADNTYNLGSSTYKWKNIYGHYIYAVESFATSAGTFSADKSGNIYGGGRLNIGANTNTTYKVHITGTTYLTDKLHFNGTTNYIDKNANARLNTLGLNGSNTNYRLYVNGTTLHTDAVYFANGTDFYVDNTGLAKFSKKTIIRGNESTDDSTGFYIQASDNSTRAFISFNGNVTNTFNGDTYLRVRSSYGDIRLQAGSGYINFASNALPGVNMTYTLGHANYLWQKIYGGSLYLNRAHGTAYGRISFYKPAFNTWVTYMSNVGDGYAPNKGKPSTLGGVTTWAIRSLIENTSGYGWLWESAKEEEQTTSSVTPTAIMSLSSNNGLLHLNGYLGINGSTTDYRLYVNGGTKITGDITEEGWIKFTAPTTAPTGLHWVNINDAKIYGNTVSTYGSIVVQGAKNSYHGIHLGPNTNYMTIMDDATNKGLYSQGQRWILYYNRTSGLIGLGNSSTVSPYRVTVDGGLYANGGLLASKYNGKVFTVGSENATYCHMRTDATSGFWMSTNLYLNGTLYYYPDTTYYWNGNAGYSKTYYTNDWFRSYGKTGWCNQDYGGGWYMSDSTWIRSFGSKNIYQDTGIMRTDGQFQVGNNGSKFYANSSGNGFFSNTLGVGKADTTYALNIYGTSKMLAKTDFVLADATAIGTTPGTLHLAINAVGAGTAVTNGTVSSLTFGAGNVAYAGIYSPSSGDYGNHLIFATTNDYSAGAKSRMTISAAGNVGIGTTSPSYKLHVSGSGYITSNLGVGAYNSNYRLFVRGNSAISELTNYPFQMNGSSYLIPSYVGTLHVGSPTVNSVSNTAGIGCSSSGITFGAAASTTGAFAGVYSTYTSALGSNLIFATTNSLGSGVYNRMTITPRGTVCIGIPYASPSYKLYVAGSAYFSGTINGTVTKANSLSGKFYANRMVNPNNSGVEIGAPPLTVLGLMNSGYGMYSDPEFASGTNSVAVYNNSGNGTVVHARVSSADGANTSGVLLRITHTGTASPGIGGFYQNISSRKNAIFAQIFRAKIPVGYDVTVASNSMGTGYSDYWVTDTAGTGKWEWYCRITLCGNTGTYSTGGHVYLTVGSGAAPTASAPVIWYLSYCNCFDLTKGAYLRATKVYGAVWNDYAEYRRSEESIAPGRSVIETGHGDLVLATERLQPGANIVSDTFGFAIGETDRTQTPIAVSGRVLAYPYEDISTYMAGDPVCTGPNGTISKMTREEVQQYPDRIIGTVSEIPQYDTWGSGDVKVDGRIWIKVK